MHQKYSHRFNVRKIVEYLGGLAATKEIMRTSGCDIKPKTVTKWVERGNLPPDAIAVIMQHILSTGREVRWLDFIEKMETE